MQHDRFADSSVPASLGGLAVLVAEDRPVIAGWMAQTLAQAGCRVTGPVATLAAGLAAVRREGNALGAAVLDIDLQGEQVFPLEEALLQHRVPCLFVTGYGRLALPAPWPGAMLLEKPFNEQRLLQGLAAAVAAGPAASGAGVPRANRHPPLVRRAWEAIRRSRDLIMEGRISQRPGGRKPCP
ncbi:response regulator [Siccirubricoccus phaeus]|uniref:response regulator n=1 Tax=Siccirubricoccus phaeus TaxID=2595053 RepID=UPI0011F1C9E5|nr:response regulator [Siccirubricoccus phaeus]